MNETHPFDPNLEIPQHVAIIMDGNGRWAKERGLKRTDGHHEGLKAIRRVAVAASQIGVKILTVYAFSTENWKRPRSEVSYLMKLPNLMEAELLPELIENNVQVKIMGNKGSVPKYTIQSIENAIDKTKDNTGLILNIAFNYGSRAEIVEAVKEIAGEVKSGYLDPDSIDEDTISHHLMTQQLAPYNDPDFLIRSSGEVRLSNYLLWQLAYSEMYFIDTKWPDFDKKIFLSCIGEYQSRQRRYGGLK
ncbi:MULTISPECIES: isoprenyl transferase [Aerococcus]|uniref:isoprenyl transferase n=1 Tax=Aerococcus TaxID=1375 RepID=UPI000DCBF736|nr:MULTISPECIES: isoprenyl transferase [Aerococcus]MDK7302551.1 isoprenyl transferase [Aerococcus urinae]RAV70231.1 isoprenyl transferase [Aerococcus urinae]RAW04443.1 isoprenyl transferase [Aerococcus urinae]